MDNQNEKNKTTLPPNGWALLPLGLFFVLYLLTWVATGELNRMPVSVAFLITSIAAVFLSKRTTWNDAVDIFCRGAGSPTILLMILIFLLAGAFAATAHQMGAVDATVQLVLHVLPGNMILAGIFLAACFISMAMGTSCGTIAALTPVAVGLSEQMGLPVAFLVGVVVGGAMFGDNLSFISDTTIAATRTLGVAMIDKFKANIRLVGPVALLVLFFYVYQGYGLQRTGNLSVGEIEWLKVLPYLVVLVTAMFGLNVVKVLALGTLLSGVIGLWGQGFTVWNWTEAMAKGMVVNMGELIVVSLLAGGIFEVIRHNGGIDWLITRLTRNLHSRRGAEAGIAALVTTTDFCTANNTIAILICGPIAEKISSNVGLDRRRIASLLDTFSCFAQAVIPYGAQLLIASGLANINPTTIIPYLYYPFLMGLVAILSIVFQYPRRYTKPSN